jgi:hypothetical protein
MRVSITGPPQRRQGEIAEYRIEVVNSGDVTLTNVRVASISSPSLMSDEATGGFRQEAGGLVWTVHELAPGMALQFQVNCRCMRPDGRATNRVTATCDQNITLADEAQTRILPAAEPETQPEPDDPPPAQPPPQAPIGELEVTAVDRSDPVRVGQPVIYDLSIFNNRNVSDREVEVTIVIPRGLKYERLQGELGVRRFERGTIYATPIAEMRAGERIPAVLELTAIEPGMHTVVVRVTSQRTRQPVAVEQTTDVFREP